MQRPDGTLTGNIMEINEITNEISALSHDGIAPKPDVDVFMTAYSHFIPTVHVSVASIDAIALSNRLQHVSIDTATGIHG